MEQLLDALKVNNLVRGKETLLEAILGGDGVRALQRSRTRCTLLYRRVPTKWSYHSVVLVTCSGLNLLSVCGNHAADISSQNIGRCRKE
jgi:hypothetical protein